MENKSITKTTITLKLNEIEASWLKRLVQNPICTDPQNPVQNPACTDPQNEDDFNKEIRRSFWDALSSVEL